MVAKGRMMLKVTGILLIVFGGIAAVIGLLAIIGGGVLGSALGSVSGVEGGAAIGGLAMIGGIVILLSAAFELVTGILGVAYSDKPQKAVVCMVLGIIMLVFQAISLISNGFSFGLVIGVALAVIYLIGAVQNKKSINAYPPQQY